MPAETLSIAWTALTTATGIARALLKLRIDAEVRVQIFDMLGRLGETQDRLFQVREELAALQNENRELREKLAENTHWESRKEQYQLVKTEGNAVVYESKSEPKHYACPSCYESRTIQILQDTNTYGGTFVCPKCEKAFTIRFPRNPPRRHPSVPMC